MRHSILLLGLVASAAAAQEATPTWQYFEDKQLTNGLLQAFVQAADGTQLILKCDAPGKQSVYAALVTNTELGPPNSRYLVRDVDLMFDSGSPIDTTWRFYPKTAMAVHTPRDKSLPRFLEGLVDAKLFEIRLYPDRKPPVSASFQVGGARDAISRVFASCKDESPLGD